MSDCRGAVLGLLDAIERRDLRAVARRLAPDASWQNVPHPPVRGRDEVVGFLRGILTWSDDVRWDVVASQFDRTRAWLERVDRFRLDGEWHGVRCNGVFEVDPAGLVREVRDYVDLGEWRARVLPVLDRLAARSPLEVVTRHLEAVRRSDRVAMAADYAPGAVLVRAGTTHSGWAAIAEYFDGVPSRLGGRTVSVTDVAALSNDVVRCRWVIARDETATAVRGVDTYVVSGGRITHQTVELLTDDF